MNDERERTVTDAAAAPRTTEMTRIAMMTAIITNVSDVVAMMMRATTKAAIDQRSTTTMTEGDATERVSCTATSHFSGLEHVLMSC